MKNLEVRDDIRLAGRVLRYHTWPHIRPQTVAEHSWQVARIILAIAPVEMHCTLLTYAISHDIGEITTGDLPYPIKKMDPRLGEIIDEIENDAIDHLCEKWGMPAHLGLPPELKWVFKLAEFIEMWEWGLEETMLGNQFARKVAELCEHVTKIMIFDYHNAEIANKATQYMLKRRELWG